jgi:hypothetical protein
MTAERGEHAADGASLQQPEGGERAAGSLLLGADSETDPVLSVVVPTLDEEEGIGDCLDQIEAAIDELGVPAEVIIADSSTDRTPEIARARGAIVVEPDEPGYGSAYRRGFEAVRGRYVVMGDGDTTYDFRAIPRLLEPVVDGDADMCLGSRLDGTIKPGAMPALHRYVGNPLLTRFLNTFYDAGVSDAHSGFRVISRDALERLELHSPGMEFASEMVMDASARDVEIAEVPITYHERQGEETLESFRDGWRHARFMLLNAPGHLFTTPGLVATLFGLVTMAISVFGVDVGGVHFGLQTMIGGTLFTITGYQILCFGLFSSVAADPIREQEDPITVWACEHFRLEHGLGAGLLVSLAGVLGMSYLLVTGLLEGGRSLPSEVWTLLASTAVVLGVLTVFASFFMSLLINEGEGRPDAPGVD